MNVAPSKFASAMMAPARSLPSALLDDMSHIRKSKSESRAPFDWPIDELLKTHRDLSLRLT